MPLPMFSDKEKISIKNIIAVAAGKGGVGKSSVTVNLAQTLQKLGYRVGVMDMDIYGPSVRQMMPEEAMPQQKGEKIRPALCRGVEIMSMAYFRKDGEASAIRAPIANGIVSQFIERVSWGPLHYLFVDFPPGTGDVQLTICQKLNLTGALMITTPQEVSLLDVRKAIDLFEQVKVPIIGIVENMSYYLHEGQKLYVFGKEGGRKLAREVGAPLLGEIPLDPIISECGDKGLPLEENRDYLQLAQTLQEHVLLLKNEARDCLDQFELIWKEMDETSVGSPYLAER